MLVLQTYYVQTVSLSPTEFRRIRGDGLEVYSCLHFRIVKLIVLISFLSFPCRLRIKPSGLNFHESLFTYQWVVTGTCEMPLVAQIFEYGYFSIYFLSLDKLLNFFHSLYMRQHQTKNALCKSSHILILHSPQTHWKKRKIHPYLSKSRKESRNSQGTFGTTQRCTEGRIWPLYKLKCAAFVLAAAQKSPKNVQDLRFDLGNGEFICPHSCSRMQQNLPGPELYANWDKTTSAFLRFEFCSTVHIF